MLLKFLLAISWVFVSSTEYYSFDAYRNQQKTNKNKLLLMNNWELWKYNYFDKKKCMQQKFRSAKNFLINLLFMARVCRLFLSPISCSACKRLLSYSDTWLHFQKIETKHTCCVRKNKANHVEFNVDKKFKLRSSGMI